MQGPGQLLDNICWLIGASTSLIRCIGTFDAMNKNVLNILRRYWPIISTDEDLKDVLTQHPSVTYWRGRNLKDLLGHSHHSKPQTGQTSLRSPTKGSHSCGGCSYCHLMPTKKEFTNPIDQRCYTIREFINCKTMGVIYIAQCTCPKIYVGKTRQQLRRRIGKHISTINTNTDTPLSRHIRFVHRGDIKSLQFWGIKKITVGPR